MGVAFQGLATQGLATAGIDRLPEKVPVPKIIGSSAHPFPASKIGAQRPVSSRYSARSTRSRQTSLVSMRPRSHRGHRLSRRSGHRGSDRARRARCRAMRICPDHRHHGRCPHLPPPAPILPRARAEAKPACVRSNSTNTPKTWKISLAPEAVVSICTVNERLGAAVCYPHEAWGVTAMAQRRGEDCRWG